MKSFFVLVLAAVSAQGFAPNVLGNFQIQEFGKSISQIHDAMTVIFDVAAKNHVDFIEIRPLVDGYSAIETLLEVIRRLLDLGIGSVESITCVANLINDPELREDIQSLIEETRKLVQLINEREANLAECDLIGGDNPTAMDHVRRAACKAAVTAEISVQTAKVGRQASGLVDVGRDLVECLGCEFDRANK